MPTVRIEAQLSTAELLKAVEQMPQPDLDDFVNQVVRLRTRPRATGLTRAESELLSKINQGVPAALKSRYDALISKRREGTIGEDEYDELLHLTSQVEELDAQRAGYLAELARLRRTTLPALMKDLGIKPPPYV